MNSAKKIFLQTPPTVNPNAKRPKALIVVDDIDGYTEFTPRQTKNFFKKVDKNGPLHQHDSTLGKCWIWTAGLFGNGYGCFSMFGRMRKPHRVSWLMHRGSIPKGEGTHGTCVLHSCDNRGCVNPDHLWLGTHTDNMRDMESKGRSDHPSGDRNGIRKHPEVLKRGKDHYWSINKHLALRGSKHPNAKLDEIKVRQIKLLKLKRVKARIIADKFGVSIPTIEKIHSGEYWAHVKVV